jgi:hypothetical protein
MNATRNDTCQTLTLECIAGEVLLTLVLRYFRCFEQQFHCHECCQFRARFFEKRFGLNFNGLCTTLMSDEYTSVCYTYRADMTKSVNSLIWNR